MLKEFEFKSSDSKNKIHAVKWEPKDKPKAILQIAHGMAEHVMRYEDFAKFLNKHGFLVCGNDHLGHGKTAACNDDFGYCGPLDGHKLVVRDLKQLHDIVSKDYPDIPYFLMGHSMGSFLCREFIETYGECLAGAIVMGTGQQPQALLAFVKRLCKIFAAAKGWKHRSDTIDKLAFGAYNRRFKPIKTGYEWLCRDDCQATRYQSDPYCGYVFTLNGFYNMFDTISFIEKNDNISKIPKDLPVFIVAGDQDPVGSYGKGPTKVYNDFKNAEIKNVKIKLYPDDRHEILNELDKDQVYDDLLKWMENLI